MTLWLVTFTTSGHLIGGAITEAETFLAALDHLDDLNLIPVGTAVSDTELPDGTAGHLRDRFLEPGEVTELLEELETE